MAKNKTKNKNHRNVQILHFMGCKTLTLSYHCMKGSENFRTSDKTARFQLSFCIPENVGFELFDASIDNWMCINVTKG
jgi:hypothetical protein